MSSCHYWSRRQFLRYAAGSLATLPLLDFIPFVGFSQPSFAQPSPISSTTGTTKPSIPLIAKQPHFGPSSTLNPKGMYNLLIVGQGFQSHEEFSKDYIKLENVIKSTPPFNSVLQRWGLAHNLIAVYADPGIGISWDITQSSSLPDVLSFPSDIEKRITTYLADRGVQTSAGLDNLIPATELWNGNDVTDCLLVVLIKADQKMSFYDLVPRTDRPYPIVAVTTSGDDWPFLIRRGLAQSIALLADEFEGNVDKAPPEELLLPGRIPNLVILDDVMRQRFLANCKDVSFGLPDWSTPLYPKDIPFFPNQGRNANEEPKDCAGNAGRLGGVKAVEGGGGYLRNVIRADIDCLMRRIPASYKLGNPAPPNADALPVKDVRFCYACRKVLNDGFNLKKFQWSEMRALTLNSQRSKIAVGWRQRQEMPLGSSLFFQKLVVDDPVAPKDPNETPLKWQYAAEVTPTDGLIIHDVKLLGRKDYFKGAENIIKSIRFTELQAVFTDSIEPLSCCRFQRHRVRCMNETGGGHGATQVHARV